jgi:glycosyltransferase involved in cell wall biosynthesis
MLRRYGPDRGRAVVSSTLYADEVASIGRSRPAGAPFRILFAGYLRPEKGIDTLLDAYRLVLRRLPEAELHLVGPGDLSTLGPQVQAAVREAETMGKVVFQGATPFGPDLFQCYADADVLALPTRSEGTPRVLVEARAFGCPVVSTPVGGVPFSVQDGHDGMLVPPNDPVALAGALLTIQADEVLRNRLRDNGLARARATTVEAFVAALVAELDVAFGAVAWRRS